MPTVTVSSHIAAPIDRVFSMFTDLDHVAETVSSIKSIEPLTTGAFHLGTRWRETREVLGRSDSAEMEVTAFEQNRTYTLTHHKAGMQIEAVFDFSPSGDGTDVRIEFGLDSQGMPPGLLSPLGWAIDSTVRDVLAHDLADLKKAAERRPS
jgi:uncharacterized protein YndB with AHSA1/START domain